MKFRNILSICVSGILVLSACEDLLNTDRTGQAIRFGVSTGSGLRTRTEYKGKQDDGSELIYWKEDGSDDVTIHMFWDGDGGADGEVKNYYVSNAYVSSDKSICKGNLSPTADGSLLWKGDFSGGDGKAHEYKHSFYSVYPANSATFKKDGKQFEFELKESLSGVDMSKAYMAAGLENVTSADSPVLQYYPMITTLYVTLVNDTDNAVTPGNIVLTSTDKPICGKYTVEFNAAAKKFAFKEALESGKKTVTINVGNQLQPKKAGKTDIAFFIIPQGYDPSTLSFKINGKEHNFGDSYKSNLVGAYKYNITVYLSEKEPDIEEPGPLPPLSAFVNGTILAEAHKEGSPFYHPGWQFGWVDGEQKIFWNNPDNYNNWEPVPDEFLWEIINGLVDLDVEGTWEMGYVVTPDDLNIFPNLRTVNIKGWFQNVEINNPNITELNIESTQLNDLHIHGCNSLTTFHVENNNNFKNIVVEDCEILEYFTLTGPSGEGVNIRCENCPVLEWFSLTGGVNGDGSPWNFPFHKDIINCPMFDHYNVPGCKEY